MPPKVKVRPKRLPRRKILVTLEWPQATAEGFIFDITPETCKLFVSQKVPLEILMKVIVKGLVPGKDTFHVTSESMQRIALKPNILKTKQGSTVWQLDLVFKPQTHDESLIIKQLQDSGPSS